MKNLGSKIQAILILITLASIQISAAIELCTCIDMEPTSHNTSSSAESGNPPCHQPAFVDKDQPTKEHDHSDCECNIDVPDDPQTSNEGPLLKFQKEVPIKTTNSIM